MSAEPRVRIGHYVLGHTIGKGSFAKVKIAEHEITGHRVAVKMLNRKLSNKANADLKIKREIKILKLLRHPHIIRLYEVIETPTDIFMIMEYVEGGELFDFIVRNGRLSEGQSRRFFQQLICAVEHIHHFRIVHRDLKPENILLDKEEKVRIADFGLSALTSDGSFLSTSCGSPNYAAPEIISGKLYAGAEVDVWSCGVVLYAFLCGRLPFDEDSVPALFKKIREGNYHMPSHLPHAAKDLIKRMLEVDPLKRISIAQVRDHAWFQEGLPPYLRLSPEETILRNSAQNWDEELLKFVAKRLDVPEDIARRALLNGTKNDISIAYYILLDNRRESRRMKPSLCVETEPAKVCFSPVQHPENIPKLAPSLVMETMMLPCSQDTRKILEKARETYNERSSFSHSPSLLGSILSLTPTNRSFGGSLKEHTGSLRVSEPIGIPQPNQVEVGCSPMSFSSGKGSGAAGSSPAISHLAAAMEMHRANILNESEPPVHQNWRLGLFTELHSNSVMQEVYKVLQSLSFTWKVHSSFHLIARQKCVKDDDAVVAIGVQLYRMQERHDRGYLVDLYVHSDLILPAVDQIHRLYMILTDVIGA
eukprot:GGOE01027405.1.p1 GENE.GGOE01027405.1~~GGOE01027405.1.p1  ORF type:complete len:599 (-),score=109.34 GGOE01027405.1:617-2389(-)